MALADFVHHLNAAVVVGQGLMDFRERAVELVGDVLGSLIVGLDAVSDLKDRDSATFEAGFTAEDVIRLDDGHGLFAAVLAHKRSCAGFGRE